jgi:hypothetical protein
MSAYPAREIRQPVRIGARLKSGRGWTDVVIRNVSPRGIMGRCAAPPARGDYVEVRCGDCVIVARVAWTDNDSFGARAQDKIVLPDLIAGSQGRETPAQERRQQARPQPSALPAQSLAARAAASTRVARTLDFLAIVLAGATAASLAAGVAHDAMARPADHIAQALSKGAKP